jgi:hypothetical protein
VALSVCHPLKKSGEWLARLYNPTDRAQTLTVGWRGAKAARISRTDLWGDHGRLLKNPIRLAPMEMETLTVAP